MSTDKLGGLDMKALIHYVDFYWDNYQGGSGKYYELFYSLDIPEDMCAGNIFEFIHKKLEEKVLKERPFNTGKSPIILRIEIV